MIEYEFQGFDEAALRIRATPGKVRDQIKDALERAGQDAYLAMQLTVPDSNLTDSGERQPHRKLRDSLAIEDAVYAPGGAGGGGFYELQVGPIDDPPEHLQFVLEGSAPVSNTLMGYPGNFFMSRAAQEPDRDWMDEAIERAKIGLQEEIRILDIQVGTRDV